ncbi:MAG: hypothetical protein JO356_14565 [Acidobacteria bacterium]|nr:hypothetical protein [Acidobacteriota bacterium]
MSTSALFRRISVLAFTLPAVLWLAVKSHAAKEKVAPAAEVQTATEIRLLDPGWWPTKGSAKHDEYAGSATCTGCHAAKAQSYAATAMAHALIVITGRPLPELSQGPLRFSIGSYNYELQQTPAGPMYSVNDGSQSSSAPIGWVFGNGEFGRTYVYKDGGIFYESRLSYYSNPRVLDFTTGNPRAAPNRLATALGRRMAGKEPQLCFGCHSTAATTDSIFDSQNLVPGVECEACHGPGARHVALMSGGMETQVPSMIVNPAQLGPVASVDFCGACHRTSVDVALSGVTGILTLRFPAYRLQRSRCWGAKDSRVACIACHDSHQPLAREAVSYDRNCLSCHRIPPDSTAKHAAISVGKHRPQLSKIPVCPVGTKDCVNCHMPKYTIPEMHATFTDHKIGIYRKGAPFAE